MYYNRNAAINQFLHMLFCTRRESKLCLTGKMEKCIIPSIDKDTHGFDGQKNVHTSSKTLGIHKVFPVAFSSSGCFSASSELLAPDSDGFSCDF